MKAAESRSYAKPWISYTDQVALLQSRGLVVKNPDAAAAALSHVKYYRFSGYGLAFETSRHTFVSGTTIESDTLRRWQRDVEHLITTHLEQLPHPYQRMGLPTDWTQHPSWIALDTQET